jgi:hypothetical protein
MSFVAASKNPPKCRKSGLGKAGLLIGSFAE